MAVRCPVLLLHGLWMHSAALGLLARRLHAAGFAPYRFDYSSVHGGPDATLPHLIDTLHALGPGSLHVVAHSLGGLMALSALRMAPELPVSRVVCLGSPLCGSDAARALARWPGAAALLGRSRDLLCAGLPAWEGVARVGMIAGSLPLGLGTLPGHLPRPHDGSVAVRETQLPGLVAHCTLRVSHSGLIFSRKVAAQTIAFLRSGAFVDSAAVAGACATPRSPIDF